MRKPKTIISIVCMFVFAVICGTHAVAQEYGIVDDRIMDFYKTKEYQKAPELLESFFNEHHPDRESSWYYPTVFFFFENLSYGTIFQSAYDHIWQKR